jgi:hypothetical protein
VQLLLAAVEVSKQAMMFWLFTSIMVSPSIEQLTVTQLPFTGFVQAVAAKADALLMRKRAADRMIALRMASPRIRKLSSRFIFLM